MLLMLYLDPSVNLLVSCTHSTFHTHYIFDGELARRVEHGGLSCPLKHVGAVGAEGDYSSRLVDTRYFIKKITDKIQS
jgi:hypothetical protein